MSNSIMGMITRQAAYSRQTGLDQADAARLSRNGREPFDSVDLGSVGRSRNADGRFRVKRGDTRLKTLWATYGQDFAAGLPGNLPLAILRAQTGMSLSQMLKNPEAVQQAAQEIKKERHLMSVYADDGPGAGGGYPPYASVDGPGAGGGYPPYASVEARRDILANLQQLEGGYTAAHMQRATGHALRIAAELGLSAADRRALEQAGQFYDAGKLEVPASILDKAGKLTDEEFAAMKLHVAPERMEKYFVQFAADAKVRETVLHHHERFDGQGYPAGLAGEQIPLTARILAVADAFDAMTQKRWNREDRPDAAQALSREAALEILRRNAGTQFDPAVVAAFERTSGVPA
ncbi:MAG: HD domain-containing phosphohydrolase [Candidatus Eremiobacterota bacterium]